MGHKVHPNGFRLGVFRPWEANWFANDKDYVEQLHEDLEMLYLLVVGGDIQLKMIVKELRLHSGFV